MYSHTYRYIQLFRYGNANAIKGNYFAVGETIVVIKKKNIYIIKEKF